MGFVESIRLALSSLSANKMRSLLTMLGIIIGIGSVITITTIGNSIQTTLTKTFNQLGSNFLYTYMTQKYVEESEDENYEGAVQLTDDDKITMDMVYELAEKYSDEFKISLYNYYSSSEIINSRNEYINVEIAGIMEGYLDECVLKLIKGRNISLRDNMEKKHTMLVSDVFVRQYFPDSVNPVGQTLTFTVSTGETYDFTIVGVYEYKEATLGRFLPGKSDAEKVTPVYIPIETVFKITGNKFDCYGITVIWNADFDPQKAESDLKSFFDEKYANNKYWTVNVENAQNQLDMINKVLNIITIAISVIAAISLIVGGVGVMNIMLVSIVERTKEIGIRKALGAKNSSIRLQFVVEAIIICLIGGIIGIITGILNGVIIGKIADFLVATAYSDLKDMIVISVNPSPSAIIIAVIFSMLTGVFFGYYPANKASKMNPIDALRYE